MLSPRLDSDSSKPNAACQPLPGIYPVLLEENGKEIAGEGTGALAFKYAWPSLARTIAGDHERYCKTYLSNGYYITGDGEGVIRMVITGFSGRLMMCLMFRDIVWVLLKLKAQ